MDLVIGRVAKAHGVTGELVVEVRTDDPDARFTPGATLRTVKSGNRGRQGTVVVDTVREHGARLLVRLAGVTDRNAADDLRGTLFVVDTDELPAISEPDTYYDHQLAGLTVRTTAGERLGTVTEVLHTGPTELLAVARADGGELLVPFVAAIVTAVSLADGIVEVDPPDGLLDLE